MWIGKMVDKALQGDYADVKQLKRDWGYLVDNVKAWSQLKNNTPLAELIAGLEAKAEEEIWSYYEQFKFPRLTCGKDFSDSNFKAGAKMDPRVLPYRHWTRYKENYRQLEQEGPSTILVLDLQDAVMPDQPDPAKFFEKMDGKINLHFANHIYINQLITDEKRINWRPWGPSSRLVESEYPVSEDAPQHQHRACLWQQSVCRLTDRVPEKRLLKDGEFLPEYWHVHQFLPDMHWVHLLPLESKGTFRSADIKGKPRWTVIPSSKYREIHCSASSIEVVKSEQKTKSDKPDPRQLVWHLPNCDAEKYTKVIEQERKAQAKVQAAALKSQAAATKTKAHASKGRKRAQPGEEEDDGDISDTASMKSLNLKNGEGARSARRRRRRRRRSCPRNEQGIWHSVIPVNYWLDSSSQAAPASSVSREAPAATLSPSRTGPSPSPFGSAMAVRAAPTTSC